MAMRLAIDSRSRFYYLKADAADSPECLLCDVQTAKPKSDRNAGQNGQRGLRPQQFFQLLREI